jgi:hypothetical protein
VSGSGVRKIEVEAVFLPATKIASRMHLDVAVPPVY